MKHNIHFIVSLSVSFVLYLTLAYFGFSFWMILLALPVLGYVQIYAANRFSFRDSLELQPVPETGYEKRIAWLDKNQRELADLGFTKIDEFYAQTASDFVAYAYKHEQYPITLIDYDMQAVRFCDLITRYDNDYSLTTTNGKNGGVVKRPDENLLQVFPMAAFSQMINAHIDAAAFLAEKNLRPRQLQSENYRHWFIDGMMEAGKTVRSPLSPLKLLYCMATNYKQRYEKPIREQYLAKTLRITM